MKILQYIRTFFQDVESVPEYEMLHAREELINGQAFLVHRYKLPYAKTILSGETFDVTVDVAGERIFTKRDTPCNRNITVDTVGITQFTDALGFKNAVAMFVGEAD